MTDPGVLAVRAGGKLKTLQDLLTLAKNHPDQATVSHEASGTGDHLALLALQRATNIKFNQVVFDGNASATAALLGGHIEAFGGNLSEVMQQVEDKEVHAIALWADKRSSLLPNLPTGTEQGANVIIGSSRGLGAPVGLADDVLAKLTDVALKVAADPKFVAALVKLGMPIDIRSGADYENTIKVADETYRGVWNVTPWVKK